MTSRVVTSDQPPLQFNDALPKAGRGESDGFSSDPDRIERRASEDDTVPPSMPVGFPGGGSSSAGGLGGFGSGGGLSGLGSGGGLGSLGPSGGLTGLPSGGMPGAQAAGLSGGLPSSLWLRRRRQRRRERSRKVFRRGRAWDCRPVRRRPRPVSVRAQQLRRLKQARRLRRLVCRAAPRRRRASVLQVHPLRGQRRVLGLVGRR